jgi:hypothetical protein
MPYEREQLEKAAQEVLVLQQEMNTWITAIQRAQSKCDMVRQKIYNTLNHEKISQEQD